MKKVLFVATVVKTHIMVFHIPYLKWFKDNGYEVHVCAKNDYYNPENCNIPYCDRFFDIPFERSPLKCKNIKAYKALERVINSNQYEIIHCHTPVGGVLTRLAARNARKNHTKLIYTAHGFHFFKGAPFMNWFLYYPIERWLAKYTDVLITINKEDYRRAKNFNVNKVIYIPGVGIDTEKYSQVKINKKEKRREIGVDENDFVILSVGELNKNKNHEVIIKAIAQLNRSNVNYIICGQGELKDYLVSLIHKYGLEKQVKLLGYRNDIEEICKVSDIFAFPSKREGLGLAALEAMSSGLPIVTSDIHGIADYSVNYVTGFTCVSKDIDGFKNAIKTLMDNDDMRINMGDYNQKLVQKFDMQNVINIMSELYTSLLKQ